MDFNEPRIALNRIYTRRGDSGDTSLVGGQRVSKDDGRIETYGTVDELNAFAGAARVSAQEAGLESLAEILHRIQHELFNLGSILATLPEDIHPRQPRVTTDDIRQLEVEIDRMNEDLPSLRSFVLPGGSRLNTDLHICRTVCRRAERLCIPLVREGKIQVETVGYLNRLSDAFFVFSRWASLKTGTPEVLWQPNLSASGKAAE
jgi:cob(I)alamin adenosyltransferase